MKVTIPFILFLVCLPSVAAALTLNLDYPKFGPYDLNENQSLPEIIAFFYYLIVGIAGLAAFVMLVWGGVQWLMSGAIPSQAAEARDKVRNAIIGLLLVLASFLIVQILNPELTVIGGDTTIDPATCAGTPHDKDGDGKCDQQVFITPQSGSTVTLTANGEEFTSVPPGPSASAELKWNSGLSDCQALSDPTGLWTGSKSQSGTETVGLSTISDGTTVRFTITCQPPGPGGTVEASAFVKVSSTGGGGSPPTIDYFQAKHKNAPETAWGEGPFMCCGGSTSFPDDQVSFRWLSSDADQCFGEDQLGGIINGPTSGNTTVLVPPFSDTYRYTLKCINGGGSTDKTILIKKL